MINEAAWNSIVQTLLTMSVSGGAVALILFAVKPLLKHRVPKAVQYYLWLVVVMALLIPLSIFIKLPAKSGGISSVSSINSMIERFVVSAEEKLAKVADSKNAPSGSSTESYTPPVNEAERRGVNLMTICMRVYPIGVLTVLFYYIISYINFARHHHLRNSNARISERALLAKLCENRSVPRIYRNQLALTPMLIGVFHPVIVLPDREYTDERLRVVLLHELTHMRRKDVFVKWLTVIACAVHWFNPVVWLVHREIDRSCELSCDEAVILNLDVNGKRNYGDTLLYVAAEAKAPRAVLSTTMCEEKRTLKERLGAIMKSRKHTRFTVVLSVALLISAVFAACGLGAGSVSSSVDAENEKTTSIHSPLYLNDNLPENTHDNNTINLSSIKNGIEPNPTEDAPADLPSLLKSQ